MSDAFSAPYTGYAAVGAEMLSVFISGTGDCACPLDPPEYGGCGFVDAAVQSCSQLCPNQCVTRVVAEGPGGTLGERTWEGTGGVLGMKLIASVEGMSGEDVAIHVDGCHGPMDFTVTIPEPVAVGVSPPTFDGSTISVSWDGDRSGDEAEVSIAVGIDSAITCRTEDDGLFETPSNREAGIVTIERRWHVGMEMNEHAVVDLFQSAQGSWYSDDLPAP